MLLTTHNVRSALMIEATHTKPTMRETKIREQKAVIVTLRVYDKLTTKATYMAPTMIATMKVH